MKKTNKILIGVVSVVAIILVTCGVIFINNKNPEENVTGKNITIGVYDKEGNSVYNKSLNTDKQYLIEVLEENKDLEIKAEDSQYGKYITSIKGIEQGDNYYWSYYIDGEYAEVGVSSCEIENDKTYDFKIEKFEY